MSKSEINIQISFELFVSIGARRQILCIPPNRKCLFHYWKFMVSLDWQISMSNRDDSHVVFGVQLVTTGEHTDTFLVDFISCWLCLFILDIGYICIGTFLTASNITIDGPNVSKVCNPSDKASTNPQVVKFSGFRQAKLFDSHEAHQLIGYGRDYSILEALRTFYSGNKRYLSLYKDHWSRCWHLSYTYFYSPIRSVLQWPQMSNQPKHNDQDNAKAHMADHHRQQTNEATPSDNPHQQHRRSERLYKTPSYLSDYGFHDNELRLNSSKRIWFPTNDEAVFGPGSNALVLPLTLHLLRASHRDVYIFNVYDVIIEEAGNEHLLQEIEPEAVADEHLLQEIEREVIHLQGKIDIIDSTEVIDPTRKPARKL
ncbi:hypothetical protein Cgig2_018925 [Carnegiea gigantea]|uniref:Uncharacterized protein n=1 Tax=Carnegiea gigantea TaxID=171969 RepID=A0A9Q1JMR0_9CARY|nr:hypothetical protein Cgig2_018925 [Carnegiea gigantea]